MEIHTEQTNDGIATMLTFDPTKIILRFPGTDTNFWAHRVLSSSNPLPAPKGGAVLLLAIRDSLHDL